MVDLPSTKTHPVLMSMFVVCFFLATNFGSAVVGWWVRTMMESRAELAVVVDDGKFVAMMKTTLIMWGDEYEIWHEEFRAHNPIVPDCIGKPMPKFYHDNDYELQPAREQEE